VPRSGIFLDLTATNVIWTPKSQKYTFPTLTVPRSGCLTLFFAAAVFSRLFEAKNVI
jgi:hypothetical protein